MQLFMMENVRLMMKYLLLYNVHDISIVTTSLATQLIRILPQQACTTSSLMSGETWPVI